jgi:hypothetical protein
VSDDRPHSASLAADDNSPAHLVEAVDDSASCHPSKPANGHPPPLEGQAEDEQRPWRGVFSPEPVRESLFTVEIDLDTANLRPWEPAIFINPHRVSDDDK